MTPVVTSPVGLDPGQLDAVFPFHLAIGRDECLTQVGSSLARMCPGLAVGERVADWLEMHRPARPVRFSELASEAPSFEVLRLPSRDTLLRGQTLLVGDRLLFLAAPWFATLAELERAGMTIADFPPHDPLVDLLIVLQAKNIALAEASAMAERLEKSRHHLEGLLADNQRIRSRLEALVSQLPWGVLVEDEVGRVALANRHFCQMFGMPFGPEAILGAACADLAQGARDAFRDPATFDASTAQRLQERCLHLNEHLDLVDGRVLERDYLPVVDAQGYRGHLWQYRDVTETLRVARELEDARQRAELANIAKDEFLAMMSHEMRTPLGVIIGLAELLRGDISLRARRDFLQRLDVNARSLMKLIEDTLDLARLEAQDVRLHVEPFDPRSLVEEVATGLGSSATVKGLELIVHLAPDVPAQVVGDEHRLRQILVNLAGNAIKFTDAGEVRVGLGARRLDADTVELAIAVQDSGHGIPEALHEVIFERFVREEGGAERRGQGTGLGLAISKNLAAAMNGRIELASEPGSGARFTLFVPLPVAAEGERTVPPLAGRRVAIACARPALAESLGSLLQGLGASTEPVYPDSASEPMAEVVLIDGDNDASLWTHVMRRLDPRRVLWLLRPGEVPPSPGAESVARPVTRAALLQAFERLGLASEPTRPKRNSGLHDGLGFERSLRLLLVEDDPDTREVITHLLGRMGHDVDAVSDGAIAFEKTRAVVYDLVVTDLRMPGLSGIELIRKVRGVEAATGRPRLPIVAVTADALSRQREAALEAGADDFLTKPLQGHQLGLALMRLADRRPIVLVVDDARDMRLLARHHLERTGCLRVAEAATASAALDLAARRTIDLVLVDLGLPDMDGLDLVAALRAAPRPCDAPILVMSGRDDETTRARCIAAGCGEILVKPVESAHLIAMVERTLIRSARAKRGELEAEAGA